MAKAASSNGQAIKERTIAQVQAAPSDDGLLTRKSATGYTYKQLRAMREDPTVKLCRIMVTACAMGSEWSVEGKEDAPEGAVDLVRDNMEGFRIHLMRTSAQGVFDFGWQPYEKVMGLDTAGNTVIKKLKPLLQDFTNILVEPATGAFLGLRQEGDPVVDLTTDECLVLAVDVEGTDWYGKPMLDGAKLPYEKWNQVELAADRYDRKVAGTSILTKYPPGTSLVNGVETDNFETAKAVAMALQSSGGAVVPSALKESLDDLEKPMGDYEPWSIEYLSDNGSGRPQFTERQKYLDALKVRGIGLPERAVLEGQFGTKAEAETHGDFAVFNLEMNAEVVVQLLNWHCVNHILRLNFGEESENSVWLKRSPLSDAKRAYIKTVYNMILTNPEGFAEELDRIDRDAVRESLGVPSAPLAEQGALGAEEGEGEEKGEADPLVLPVMQPPKTTGRGILDGMGVSFAFNPSQPRDDAGRFGEGSGSGSAKASTPDEWRAALNEKQAHALKEYIENDNVYGWMRTAQLREQGIKTEREVRKPFTKQEEKKLANAATLQKDMDSALETAPNFQGEIYRGMKITPNSPEFADYAVGKEVTFNAHASASASQSEAQKFGQTLFVMKSKSGVDMSGLSKKYEEREVLVRRDTKFRVTAIPQKAGAWGGRTIIEMEEV